MKVLGINALFHDPAAALVVDGAIVAAAEEERFSRRKHGKRPLPFSAWELPEKAALWCLEYAGLRPRELDAVAYSYNPEISCSAVDLGLDDPWDWLRQLYARQVPTFLSEMLPGLDPEKVTFVQHHVAHAASAGLASSIGPDADVLVLDGRGEVSSHLAGTFDDGELTVLQSQHLPHSLGLVYETLTEHLGFLRSSDEYKVMALSSYGQPHLADALSSSIRSTGDGGFIAQVRDWFSFAPRRRPGTEVTEQHADLAASVQLRVEQVMLDLAGWLHGQTGKRSLVLAGGVALNCVANSRLHDEGPYDNVWVQPAAGDAGTALGAALHVARADGRNEPLAGVDLGRGWSDAEIEEVLRSAGLPFSRPPDVAVEAAECLAANGLVAWFQGRSEFGPRALGRRSLLAHPGHVANLERLNHVKGREAFRPVAPMVLEDRASEIFTRGPLPSPYMLFVHDVKSDWQDRIPAALHVDGTARVQTVSRETEPQLGRLLERFESRTDLPVVINTSLNTAGRPMLDHPREALECIGSAPVDLLAIGPFVVRRPTMWSA